MANATHDGTEVQNDFDSIYPWSDIKTYNYNTTTKQITAFIGEPTFKFDGTNGEVMTRFPEFWYKREQKTEGGNTYEYIHIADFEAEGFVKSEQFSLSRYTASGTPSRLHSKSETLPLFTMTPENYRIYARALGNGWGLLDIWHWSILQILYLVEYADYNVQNILGQGSVANQAHGVNYSGGCDSLEMKSGCLGNDGTYSIIYRGIEDIYGNMWQFCDGININNCQAYVCNNPEEYICDLFDEPYYAIGYRSSTASGQYTKKVGYDKNNSLFQLPIEGEGNSNTYITDTYYCSVGEGAYRVVWVGGAWSDNTECGLWCFACSDPSSSASNLRVCRLLLNQ